MDIIWEMRRRARIHIVGIFSIFLAFSAFNFLLD